MFICDNEAVAVLRVQAPTSTFISGNLAYHGCVCNTVEASIDGVGWQVD